MVLLAFVGLTVDVGQLYIHMGSLRKAVDAGALAAAAQFREGRNADQLAASAEEIMQLNGIDPTTVVVETCESSPGDEELCVTPRRKLVRVTGEMDAPTSFLTVIGIHSFHIASSAISEAASMDVVLVIDISESMANDSGLCDGDDDDGDGVADDGRSATACVGLPAVPAAGPGSRWDNYYADPSKCNPSDRCHPFEEVKSAAINFIDRVLDLPVNEESDRLAIVTFSNGWEPGSDQKGTRLVPPGWMSNRNSAENAVRNLKVYQPEVCPSAIGSCRHYDTPIVNPGDPENPSDNYLGFGCPTYTNPGEGNPSDPSSCTTTNIGGGLLEAGNLLGDPDEMRDDALWVVVLLTDGAANATTADPADGFPFGYCPESTWAPPFCRDRSSATRHSSGNAAYDADDFSRDMADFVGCDDEDPADDCSQTGQNAAIFTIGLGNQVVQLTTGDPIPHGVSLLRYIAAVGDDGDPATDLCAGLYDNMSEFQTWCGNYYFEAQGNQLNRVFEDIASRMFTRITH